MSNARPEESEMWAVFAPDGYIQVRSIADTKRISQKMICQHESVSWKDYKKAGYYMKKIFLQVKILD